MALIIKDPIATLHKKEQHISIKPMRKTRKVRKSLKKTASNRPKRVCNQLKLRLR